MMMYVRKNVYMYVSFAVSNEYNLLADKFARSFYIDMMWGELSTYDRSKVLLSLCVPFYIMSVYN